jgi:hypothetical protein
LIALKQNGSSLGYVSEELQMTRNLYWKL